MKTTYTIFFCFFFIFGFGQIPSGLFPDISCGIDNCTNCNIIYQSSSSSCPSVGNGRAYDSKFLPSPIQPICLIADGKEVDTKRMILTK